MAASLTGTSFFTKASVNATTSLSFILTYAKKSSDVTNNSSVVTIRAYLYYNGGVSDVNSDYSTFKVDGTTIKSTGYSAVKGDYLLLGSTDKTISHNADGTFPKTRVSYSLYSYHWRTTTTGTAYIPSNAIATISRASAISSASNITLPSACSIKWTPSATSFYYKLKFSIGSTTLYTSSAIHPGTTSEYTYTGYTLPITTANYITQSNKGTVTVALSTYSDSACTTQIGSAQTKTFTATVPSNSSTQPTLSVTLTLDNSGNSTVNGWGIYVAGYSKAKLSSTPTAKYGATISNFTISGEYSQNIQGSTLNYTGGVITSSGTKTFTVKATDSRGISSSEVSKTASVYAYTKPSISSFSAVRDENTPTTIRVSGNWTYSSVNSKNKIQAVVKRKPKTSSSYTTIKTISAGTTTSVSISNTGLSETTSYDYQLVITDSLGNTATSTISVSTAAVLLDFRAGGRGLGIGKAAETDSLEVALPAKFSNSVQMNGIGIMGVVNTALSKTLSLDSVTEAGIYYQADWVGEANIATYKYPVNYPGILEVYYKSASYIMQKYTNRDTPTQVWSRFLLNGTWSEWLPLCGAVNTITATSATLTTSSGKSYFLPTSTAVHGTKGTWKILPTPLINGFKKSTSTTTIGSTSGYFEVLEDQRVVNSSLFEFTASGGIKCKHSGIVQASGHIRLTGATNGDLISGAIYKLESDKSSISSDGYNIGGVYDDVATTSGSKIYANVSIPLVNVKVNAGDKLYLMFRNNTSANGAAIGSDCMLTVTYITY